MFALIKNDKILHLTDVKPDKKDVNFDIIIEFNYENWNQYNYIDWDIVKDIIKMVDTINKEFQNSINQFTAWYSQAEVDTWKFKEEQAIIVDSGGTSEFLTALSIDGETEQELATKILANAICQNKIQDCQKLSS